MHYKYLISFIFLFCGFFLISQNIQAQPTEKSFTHQDTLRGSIGEGRQKWNVLHYDLTIEPNFNKKTITGINKITYWDEGVKLMQMDLQEPMQIDSVRSTNGLIKFYREKNVYWLLVRDTAAMYKIKPGLAIVTIYFSGKPKEARNAPWDGGWIWKKDELGNPWMTVACQGLGASVWYPCKDTQSDEPDSGAILRIITPDSLMAVGNGRLINTQTLSGNRNEFIWKITAAINNYNLVPYIGKYVHIAENYAGEKGNLTMDYWVMNYNEEKAKNNFGDAKRMMKAFEYWFGPYPFYEDGYKLVEAPHLGMEHQSAVAYGNKFKNGYLGRDLSGKGWGLKWDFIIVHESGHEWFGNSITSKDVADMWIHESFTNYSETLFTDYYYGKQAGNEYCIGTRKAIVNDKPIIGPYGVNQEGSGDMYYKGGNMIHYLRKVINNDEKFRQLLRGLNKQFYHQTVTTAQVENYINTFTGFNFNGLFNQYLRTTKVPILEYSFKNKQMAYRWQNIVDNFNMPVNIGFDSSLSNKICLRPSLKWKYLKIKSLDNKLWVDPNFYIKAKEVSYP